MWVEGMLRSIPGLAMDALNVHAMEGDGNAVRVCMYHNVNPSVQQPAICLIDGDSAQAEDVGKGILRLLGQNPESYIFDQVLMKLDTVAGELAVALLRPYEEHQKIEQSNQKCSEN